MPAHAAGHDDACMDIYREFNKVLENLIANLVREYELACYKYYANY